ncbi:MAG: phosphatase PAP2 family protein [Dehalococcoidia bacterium]|nr:phosphatase PAP2 family protein [Dehalococcoidia bacterium]
MSSSAKQKRGLWIAVEAFFSLVGLAAAPVAALAVCVLLGWVSLRVTGQLLDWDTQLYSLINGWSRPEVTGIVLLLLNDPGIDYVAIIIPTLLYVWFRRRRQIPWAVIAVLITLVMGSMTFTYTQLFGLWERPFVSLTSAIIDPQWRQVWLLFATFPSGHLRETVGLSVVLAYFWPAARWPVFGYAFLIAFTRLYLGAHFPTDVAAGGFIGVMDGAVAVFTVNRLDWFLRLGGSASWIRSAYSYVFVPRTPGEWSQDPLPARCIRLIFFLGALAGGAWAGGWAINFQGLRIVYDLMRNFDNSVTQPLLIRFDPAWAETLYRGLGNGQIVYPVLGALTLLAAARRGWRELGRGVMVVGLSVLLAYLAVRLLAARFDRPLPFGQLQNSLPQEWRLPWASLTAFPQRHMLLVAALAAALAHFARPALPLAYAYMLAVAAMLLYFGAAWPTDILISMLIGQGMARYAIFVSQNLGLEPREPRPGAIETVSPAPETVPVEGGVGLSQLDGGCPSEELPLVPNE